MTTLSRLLTRLRRLSAPPGPAADEVLLDRFARLRDEDAFAALLARHGPMVLNACRRVLRDAGDVEDAFQATFLVLARKAGSLRRPEALGGWLYGVACRVARQARDARRAQGCAPLTEPADPRPDPLAEVSARDLLDALEREVQGLPRAYRLPVVFCCLEGLSLEEAAGRLGCTPGSVKGRLERGRRRLHERLVERGWSLGAALAVASVARQGVPSGLLVATVRAGRAFVEGAEPAAIGVSEQVLMLTQGGLQVMAISKLRWTLVMLVVLGLAGAGAGWLGSGSGAADRASKPRTPATAEAGKKKEADLIKQARTRLREVEKAAEVKDEALTEQVVKARQQLAEVEAQLRDAEASRARGPGAEELALIKRQDKLEDDLFQAKAATTINNPARRRIDVLEQQLDLVRKERRRLLEKGLSEVPSLQSLIKFRKQLVRLEEDVRVLERKRSALREDTERRREGLAERIRQLEGETLPDDHNLRGVRRSLEALRREVIELRREVERLRAGQKK